MFEARHQSLDNDARLVECIVKQNIKAQMTQPLNTLEWIFVFLGMHQAPNEELLSGDAPNKRKANGEELIKMMKQCLTNYDEHADVKGYDMQCPPPKRRRSNRAGKAVGQPATTEDPKEDSVKVV